MPAAHHDYLAIVGYAAAAQAQPATRKLSYYARDRGLRAHRTIQNALAAWATARGFRVVSPGTGEPAFDVGWWDRETFFVAEVKSLRSGLPPLNQMRLGLGQALDYRLRLRRPGREVRAVLSVERDPGTHWVSLCQDVSVTLVWPGEFDRLVR